MKFFITSLFTLIFLLATVTLNDNAAFAKGPTKGRFNKSAKAGYAKARFNAKAPAQRTSTRFRSAASGRSAARPRTQPARRPAVRPNARPASKRPAKARTPNSNNLRGKFATSSRAGSAKSAFNRSRRNPATQKHFNRVAKKGALRSKFNKRARPQTNIRNKPASVRKHFNRVNKRGFAKASFNKKAGRRNQNIRQKAPPVRRHFRHATANRGKAQAKTKRTAPNSSKIVNTNARQLQKKYKHAKDFGVTGNYNKANATKFNSAINKHINSSGVKTIKGTYRGSPVTHYVNPKTGLNVMTTPKGAFVSGYKLNAAQLRNVTQRGSL